MFLATSSIFWWWTLRNLVISDHIILEKKASMIGIFVCSWCCFFPICKYLETFKRFVEEEHFHWHVDEDIHWNFLIQPIPLFQMPAYVCLFRLIIISCYFSLLFGKGNCPPPPHNLTPANHHVKHSFSFLFP